MTISTLDLVARLGLAIVLGASLGLERDARNKLAGIRTHSLVALGSALFTIAGAFSELNFADQSRIAAQVVTGIGFIGAGTIVRHRGAVSGITTATTLWIAAAMGVASGMGMYLAGVIAGVGALIVVLVLGQLKPVMLRRGTAIFHMTYNPGHGTLGPLFTGIEAGRGRVKDFEMSEHNGVRDIAVKIIGLKNQDLDSVVQQLLQRQEVKNATWVARRDRNRDRREQGDPKH